MDSTFIHHNLHDALTHAYIPHELHIKKHTPASESIKHGACTFALNTICVAFRAAHITPRKAGQFVTLWKRTENGLIAPYEIDDPIDLFIISVRDDEQLGHFIFPKQLLWKKEIVAKAGHGGKRALRVYPPWDTPKSAHAKKMQKWQCEHFYRIAPYPDGERLKALFKEK